MKRPDTYVLAVDVGQANDYTAVAILRGRQTVEKSGPWHDQVTYGRKHELIHLERFREIPYPDQVRRIVERYRELERAVSQERKATSRLVVDATGVGKPILDELREADLQPKGVIITAGETTTSNDGVYRVPKRELVTTLQVALQARRLQIAEELPLAKTLLQELRGFRVKITLGGHARFGNDVGVWRDADHDDLVLAVSLGVWSLERGPRPGQLHRLRVAGGLTSGAG